MAGITSTAIVGLTTSAVAALSTSQVASLAAASVGELTTTQIAALTTAQVVGLTASQTGALQASQMSGFSTTQLAVMQTADVAGLKSSAIAALFTDQIGALSTPARSRRHFRQRREGADHDPDCGLVDRADSRLERNPGCGLDDHADRRCWTTTQISGPRNGRLCLATDHIHRTDVDLSAGRADGADCRAHASAGGCVEFDATWQPVDHADIEDGSIRYCRSDKFRNRRPDDSWDRGAMSTSQVAGISAAAMPGLTTTQVAALFTDQIMDHRSPVAGMGTTQVSGLSTTQLAESKPMTSSP